jgi:hypothetical protein
MTAKRRRCEGVNIKEVRGQNKNVRCDARATVSRELPTSDGKPKVFHYCAKCAEFWDRRQAILHSAGLV